VDNHREAVKKTSIILAALTLASCTKPCEGTAKHAAAMMRYCKDTDASRVCATAYDSVQQALTTGACSAEVVSK
jgi:hypothetical protein